jgi:glycosyltransferase involved in cell wall biosynthesis
LNILQVTTDTHYGGVQEVVLAICRNASAQFRHFVLRIRPGRLEEDFRRCSTVLDAKRRFENSILEAIRGSGADIVHAHLPGGTCPKWLRMAARSGVPIVENIHCVFPAIPLEEELTAARIVASEYAASLHSKREGIHVIPHPISGDFFESESEPETRKQRRAERVATLGIPEDGIAIGRFGNIAPWKRIQDFIAVVPLVLAWTKNDTRPISFSIAGSSQNAEFLKGLQELAARLGVGDRIAFLGDMPNKYAYLSMLDVFLYPTSKETYCIAAAEAMAMGKLVISYRESALPETVGNAGVLVENGNLQALAEATTSYVRDPAAWCAMEQLAARTVRNRNLPEIVVPRYEEIYSGVAR